ncbi:hypothetical protein ACWEXZ_01775 [Staphylococcus xylosus]
MFEQGFNTIPYMLDNAMKILSWIGSMALDTLNEFLKALGY